MASTTIEVPVARNDAMAAGPRPPRLPGLAWIRLMRVYEKLQRQAALTSQRHDLSLSRFDVLNHAGVREGRTQQELADALFVTKGNICQLLDAMAADGLLQRRREGRVNRIYLSATGRALRATILADHDRELAARFQGLSRPEQETLLSLLAKLDRSLI